MRALVATAMAVVLSVTAPGWARAADPWETFSIPPPLPAPDVEGRVTHDGAKIWFATFGSGQPVVVLHGYGGSADTLGYQIPALVAHGRRVIAIDSRGQGRSTRDSRPFSYELMETDVIAVMDALGVQKADVVGWSDGAILCLIMAMKHPERERRIFAFSPNTDPSGVKPDLLSSPIMAKTVEWLRANYLRLSPAPGNLNDLLNDLPRIAAEQPKYTAHDLAQIHGPEIAIVDGDHEELIFPAHTQYIARTIPGAKLVILKNVSHAAPVQDYAQFNKAMIDFLDGRPAP